MCIRDRGCGAYSRAALINFFVPAAPLIRGRRLIEGGAYSSKYGEPSSVTMTEVEFIQA